MKAAACQACASSWQLYGTVHKHASNFNQFTTTITTPLQKGIQVSQNSASFSAVIARCCMHAAHCPKPYHTSQLTWQQLQLAYLLMLDTGMSCTFGSCFLGADRSNDQLYLLLLLLLLAGAAAAVPDVGCVAAAAAPLSAPLHTRTEVLCTCRCNWVLLLQRAAIRGL
jgi:hypothetical protein